MGAQGFGSSIVIALAAALWLAYLVPTWFRRREYLSTERNAVRLQQTLRIMAETAEVPEQVRAETSARSAAAQERLMNAQRRKTAIATEPSAAKRSDAAHPASTLPAAAQDVARGSLASRRLRRSRALTSLVLLTSLVGAAFGVAPLLAGSWLLLASSVVVAIGAFVMLGQMSAVATTRAQLARELRQRPAARVNQPLFDAEPESISEKAAPWTPVPLPKPLYLSNPRTEGGLETVDSAAELRTAAIESEKRLREAQESPAVTPISRPAATASPAPKAPSRFARMGYLDGVEPAGTDLDAVLERRRASAG